MLFEDDSGSRARACPENNISASLNIRFFGLKPSEWRTFNVISGICYISLKLSNFYFYYVHAKINLQ